MTARPLDSARPEAAPTVPSGPTTSGAGFIFLISLANFALWIAILGPVVVTLQIKVQQLVPDPSQQALALSLVLGIGSLFGIVVNPIAGRLSDRTTARIGMRRPWLIAGALITVLGTVVLAVSTSVPLFAVGWVVTMIGLNTLLAVLVALLPDHVALNRRGLVSGFLGVGQALGGAVGAAIAATLAATSLSVALIAPAVVALIVVGVVAVFVKDRRITKEQRPPLSARTLLSSYWVSPRRFPDFGWVWISRFLMFLGITSLISYQLLFLQRQLHLSLADATATVPKGIGVQVIAIIIVSAICGPLSDRLRRRKPFVIAAAGVGVIGLVVIAFATALPSYLVAMGLLGVAQAIYFSVDLALVTDVLPDIEKDAAKDIGVFNLSNLVPQVLAPALAPAFLVIPVLSVSGAPNQNYTMLFLSGAVFAVLSAVAISRVKKVR